MDASLRLSFFCFCGGFWVASTFFVKSAQVNAAGMKHGSREPVFIYDIPPKFVAWHFLRPAIYLATGCDDGKICVRDLLQNECVATLSGHSDKLRCLAFSENGGQLISGANDRLTLRWSLADFKQLDVEPLPANPTCVD